MPTYDYLCEACGHQEELFQKITAEPLKKCPSCSKETYRRRPGKGVGLSFKGEGFYANDYASNKNSSTDTPPPSEGGGCCPCGKNKPSCQ